MQDFEGIILHIKVNTTSNCDIKSNYKITGTTYNLIDKAIIK